MRDVDLDNFVDLAMRTSATRDLEGCMKVLNRIDRPDLRQAIISLIRRSEILGEEANRMKRAVFYGKEPLTHSTEWIADETILDEWTMQHVRLLHAGIGMLTEAIEFLAAVRLGIEKHGKFDLVNLLEEVGDSAWYHAEAIDACSTAHRHTYQPVLQTVIDKLRKRFVEKFTADEATTRDLDAERTVLEEKLR